MPYKSRKPIKRRVGKKVKPYLLPECPLEYARGIYQGEGTHVCVIDTNRKGAGLRTKIHMKDKEALEPLVPCFGTPLKYRGPEVGWELERSGKPAIEIAEALAITPYRKQQITEARKKCEYWKKDWEKI